MSQIIFKKKGVSPIIAAVLLVVITIAIGATTMAFIRSLADTNLDSANEAATRILCGADLNLEIPIVNDQYKICYYNNSGDISLTFHNKGTINIKGFQYTAIMANDTIFSYSSTQQVNKSQYKAIEFKFPRNFTNAQRNVSQYIIEPKIQGAPGKGDTICSDVAIVRDVPSDISLC